MLGDLVEKVVSKIKGEHMESKNKPKLVAYFTKEEGVFVLTIKNIGNEAAIKGNITCLTFAGRNLPERKVFQKEFTELYPFAEREFTLVDIAPVDKKLEVLMEYGSPVGKRHSEKQEFKIKEE